MGIVMLFSYLQYGGIDVADYPKYIIPYTPICISLIVCTALLPLIFKFTKKFVLPILSILSVLLFLGSEIVFEQVAVFTDLSTKMNIETWQMLSCVMTPQVSHSIWDSLSIRYNSSFKIHFYAIALLIVLASISTIYGFYKMAYTQNFERKKPLVVQFVSVLAFISLCILACFTAFFRTGDITISALSAILMTIFFMLFGISSGVYTGTLLYGKQKFISVIIPSATAILVTLFMYFAEMVMMDWNLFRFGNGFLFDRLGVIPFSLLDIMTMLLSGAVTYFILTMIKTTESKIIK